MAVGLLAGSLSAQTRPGEQSNREPVGALARETATLQKKIASQGSVQRLDPRLLERGDRWPIVLDTSALDQAAAKCTTVFVLGTRNVGFSVQFGADAPKRGEWPVPSVAGFASVTKCGAEKSALGDLHVVMRSSRGLLEVLVLQSWLPPTSTAELLPSRWAGSSIDAPQVGPRPVASALSERLKLVQEQQSKRGARAQSKRVLRLDGRGQSSVVLTLGEGCHQLHFLAETRADVPADLDAQLLRLPGGDEVGRDDGDSPQAVLRECTGRAGPYRATVIGGVPDGSVTLVHAEWDMAQGLPVQWGPQARGEMAQALWRELPPRHSQLPVASFVGVQGRTHAWLQTRPRGCYLVGVTAMQGSATRLVIEVEGRRVSSESQALRGQSGTSLSFCADGEARTRIRVVSAGAGLAWLAAVWEFPEGPSVELAREAAL